MDKWEGPEKVIMYFSDLIHLFIMSLSLINVN